MGKRSDGSFDRIERNFYPTPRKPVLPLLPFLDDVKAFCEPFAGNGALTGHLRAFGHLCFEQYDIEPQGPFIARRDALTLTKDDMHGCSHIISNPPWPSPRAGGEPTLGLIRHLSAILPTWFLLSADFMHNTYAPEVMDYCPEVVAVGRVKWIPDTKHDGVDNAAWYHFDKSRAGSPTFFYPRNPSPERFASDIEALL